MTSDKLSGPKVRITVCKFLPAVFLDAMIDSPSISAQMLESEHEHPELIWNEKTRERVSSTVRRMADNFYKNQMQDPNYQWKDPDMLAEISTSELVVSGVYLRLYAANPGWTLRRPRQFLSDLLDFIVENANRSGTPKEILDTASTALVGFLNNSPHMADAVPVLGHIPKLFRQLTVQPRSTLTVLHTLSMSEVRSGWWMGVVVFYVYFCGKGKMENFCTFYHLNCIRAKENYTSYIARMQKQSAASSLISRNEGNLVKFNLLNVSFPLNFLHLSLTLARV